MCKVSSASGQPGDAAGQGQVPRIFSPNQPFGATLIAAVLPHCEARATAAARPSTPNPRRRPSEAPPFPVAPPPVGLAEPPGDGRQLVLPQTRIEGSELGAEAPGGAGRPLPPGTSGAPDAALPAAGAADPAASPQNHGLGFGRGRGRQDPEVTPQRCSVVRWRQSLAL